MGRKNHKIEARGTEITVLKIEQEDFLSLTDIARHKDSKHTDMIIHNWMRNRNTIELLGFWESIYNPHFKPLEFEGFRKQAGLKRQMPLASFQNQEDMAGLLHTETLLLNLLLGFLSNSNSM